jgi:LmbE family N-acetylglucosaminyl deacetylase
VEAHGVRVLAVVAHPDDELLSLGGTLLRHLSEGDRVKVLIECVTDLRDGAARMGQADTVASEAGWSLDFGVSPQLPYEVPDLTIEADIVYTHCPDDLNRGHRIVSEAVRVACRANASAVRSLRYIEPPDEGTFAPNLWVDIDAHLGEKVNLYGHYGSEHRPWPHPRAPRAIIDRARHWGSVAGLRAAEPFVIARERW